MRLCKHDGLLLQLQSTVNGMIAVISIVLEPNISQFCGDLPHEFPHASPGNQLIFIALIKPQNLIGVRVAYIFWAISLERIPQFAMAT
jgi:hypothetical protein